MKVKENPEPHLLSGQAPPADQAEEKEEQAEGAGPLGGEELRASIEALLYAAEEPLSIKDLAKALPETSRDTIQATVEELVRSYDAPGRGLQVTHVAGGYQIATRPEYHERITRLFSAKRPSRLSIQALETLAAIAYRQPVTVPEIMELRGLHSAGVVRTLLEKKLVRIVGRKKVVGRPLLYGTTKEFLLRFGLKGLGDLPNLEDMAEVFGEDIANQLGDVMKETGPGEGEEPGGGSAVRADDAASDESPKEVPDDDAPDDDTQESS